MQRTAVPAPGCAVPALPVLCGTSLHPNKAHPPIYGQKIPAEPVLTAGASHLPPLRWTRPSAPGCFSGSLHGRGHIHCSPAAPAPARQLPADCFCLQVQRTGPAPAYQGAPPATAPPKLPMAPASKTPPHGGRGGGRGGSPPLALPRKLEGRRARPAPENRTNGQT